MYPKANAQRPTSILNLRGAAKRVTYDLMMPEKRKAVNICLAPADKSAYQCSSLVARDFLSVAIYGPDGSFVGVRRPGSNKPITVDGKDIVIEELIGATGMQLKVLPVIFCQTKRIVSFIS